VNGRILTSILSRGKMSEYEKQIQLLLSQYEEEVQRKNQVQAELEKVTELVEEEARREELEKEKKTEISNTGVKQEETSEEKPSSEKDVRELEADKVASQPSTPRRSLMCFVLGQVRRESWKSKERFGETS